MARNNYVIHTEEEIAGIRRATSLAASVREHLRRTVRPGMSTAELDCLAGETIRTHGGESAFYGYRGFPGQICISVNDEVVHGIGRPDRIIQMGDLISIDCGVRYEGCIGDTACTVSVGPPSAEAVRLLRTTEQGLHAGIEAATGGASVKDIGGAVEAVVEAAGMSVVRDYVGHGCGTRLHEPPEVPNFATDRARERLRPGMVLAIEPMVNLGTHRVRVDNDGWTVRTADGALSAHFEHMILITETEPEILTWLETP